MLRRKPSIELGLPTAALTPSTLSSTLGGSAFKAHTMAVAVEPRWARAYSMVVVRRRAEVGSLGKAWKITTQDRNRFCGGRKTNKNVKKSARARERRGKMGRTDYFRWSLGQGRER